MQLKYSFKKEWLHFSRTFRIFGMILAIFSFAIADPLMYRALGAIMDMAASGGMDAITGAAAVGVQAGGADVLGEISSLYNDAGLIFGVTMAEFCSTSTLIIMLILMAAAGGEQKKRATVIPACSGLEHFNYLFPKFIVYPLSVFAVTFVSCICAGALCNALFTVNIVGWDMVVLAAALCSVYMAFITAVYLSIGLCTGRPGIVTVFMYIGTMLVQIILSGLDLEKFNPFTLRSLVSGGMFSDDFVLADEMMSITVGTVLAIAVSVLMFLLCLAVQKAKAINNREDRPEF